MITAQGLMKTEKESELNSKTSGLLWLAAIATQGSWYQAAGASLALG